MEPGVNNTVSHHMICCTPLIVVIAPTSSCSPHALLEIILSAREIQKTAISTLISMSYGSKYSHAAELA